jgi:hypothetical protein
MEANQEILIESDPSFYMRFNNKGKFGLIISPFLDI